MRLAVALGLAATLPACSSTNAESPSAGQAEAPSRSSFATVPSPSLDELLAAQESMVADRDAMQRGDLLVADLRSSMAQDGTYDIVVSETPPEVRVSLPKYSEDAAVWFRNVTTCP